MSLDLRQTECGVTFSVIVAPASRKTEIRGLHDGAIKLSVTAAAERGKANKAVIGLLARQLQLSPSNFEILSGHGSRHKNVLVIGATAKQLRQKLAQLLS